MENQPEHLNCADVYNPKEGSIEMAVDIYLSGNVYHRRVLIVAWQSQLKLPYCIVWACSMGNSRTGPNSCTEEELPVAPFLCWALSSALLCYSLVLFIFLFNCVHDLHWVSQHVQCTNNEVGMPSFLVQSRACVCVCTPWPCHVSSAPQLRCAFSISKCASLWHPDIGAVCRRERGGWWFWASSPLRIEISAPMCYSLQFHRAEQKWEWSYTRIILMRQCLFGHWAKVNNEVAWTTGCSDTLSQKPSCNRLWNMRTKMLWGFHWGCMQTIIKF